jgi:hypothetical protein
MYECSLNVNEMHPLFNNDVILGKLKKVNSVNDCKRKINSCFGIDETLIQLVHEVSWVIKKGQTFVSKQCEVAFGELNGFPEFGTVNFIWVTKECIADEQI